MKFKFDSVVFHTSRLERVRSFYEGRLGFVVATFDKAGESLPDCSGSYVNYQVGGGMIGFEVGEAGDLSKASAADLVLRVKDYEEFFKKVQQAEIPILMDSEFFFMIADPDGRTLIFESDDPV